MRGQLGANEDSSWFNEKTAWPCVQFLKGLIGMGVPLNAISTGIEDDFIPTKICQGTALDVLFQEVLISCDIYQYTHTDFSFHMAIAQYLIEQGADLGGTKAFRDFRIPDFRVVTWLPLVRQRNLDIKDG